MSTEARTISFRRQIAIAISLSPDGNWPHNASSKIVSGMTIAEDQGRAPSCPTKVSCNEVPEAATPSKMPAATNLGSCAMSKFECKLYMPDWKFHHRHRLAIKLTGFSGAGEHSDDSILYLPWRKLPSKVDGKFCRLNLRPPRFVQSALKLARHSLSPSRGDGAGLTSS
jgi:hypothetical protein